VASDVVIFNSEDLTVKVNGSEVDYTWTFPDFEVWANSYTIDITWTSFTADFSVYIFKNYL
jgi:hypothetical protein